MKSEPIYANAKNYDPKRNRTEGLRVAHDFLDLNKISTPSFNTHTMREAEGQDLSCAVGCYYPTEAEIYAPLERAASLSKDLKDYNFSFTGSKTDYTSAGILAHEVGHHVHLELAGRSNIKTWSHAQDKISIGLVQVRKREVQVSWYEPDLLEMFAEAMRIFILNPNLMKTGRPERFKYLTETCNLKPLHDVSWKRVMKHASPRIIRGCEGWIIEGTA